MKAIQITIEATVNQSPEIVWDHYTNAKHIVHWNFASDDWHCPKAENNPVVGGTYFSRMEAKDGSFGFDFRAIYEEVIPNEKLVYSLEDGRKVTTVFEQAGTTTNVTTIFAAENQNPVEMQKAGWQAILNNFKSYVERNNS
ncbi:SRPBCC family protein [Flavobacterium sp.]|uniref:SRPBCC family protein n=1 Tax=Flavobacterium sp. TaxID=239 RepID=UPI00352838D1